jgi:predicted metal-dependent peptidase
MSQLVAKRSEPVTQAISAMLVQEPFFASLLLDFLDIVETNVTPSGTQIRTAATDGKTLWINTEEFGKLTNKERIGVLAHEVMHVILQHNSRMAMYVSLGLGPDLKTFSPKKFNHACDYIINAYLTGQTDDKGQKKFHLPLGTLQNSQVGADDIVDEVYLKLPDEEDNKDDNFDDHEAPADPSSLPQKPTIQAALAKAAEISKMQGKGVGGMQRLIDDICNPQVPWHELLRKALTTVTRGRDTHTWARPNRRKLAMAPHVYYPGKAGWKGPHIAVEIDTSGSIGEKELSTFMGELGGILTDLEPEMVYVMYVDDELHGDVIEIDDVNNLSEVKHKAGGGGGTDMTTVFRVIEERQLPVETVVVLTDGYTPFPEEETIPTIWCMTTQMKAPNGTTVHVEVKQD